MKTSRQVGWQYGAFGAAAIVAVSLTLGLTPRPARAAGCTGDCNASGAVTQDELLTMTNIALGNAAVSTCMIGDLDNSGDITVNEIITAVNFASTSCPSTSVCGNGVIEAGETCDNGGTCIGGTDTGKACTAESDCAGSGICEGGTKYFFACTDDSGCPGGTCIHCKPFGGQGCAANCTAETDVVLNLVPGATQGISCKPNTSCAIPHGDVLTLPLPLTGTQTLTIGTQSADGTIPVVSKAASVAFPKIPVSGIACACLRGVAAQTCGGTLYNIDGVTLSPDCTPGFVYGTCSGSTQSCTANSDCPSVTIANGENVQSCVGGVCANCRVDSDCSSGQTCTIHTCDGGNPCYYLHGPGNAASGVVGCGAGGFSPVDVLFDQDSGGGGPVGKPIITLSGSGPAGSALLLSNNAIGTVTGACTGSNTADYGPDGIFCTDDDPQDQRGDPSPQFLVTGTATGKIENANQTPGDDLGSNTQCNGPGDPDPCCTGLQTGTCGFSVTGNPLVCTDLLETQNVSGAALAAAFVELNVDILLDIVTTSVLVGQ